MRSKFYLTEGGVCQTSQQFFYCWQMGHLARNCPRKNARLEGKCKQDRYEVDNCQEKLALDCMGVRAEGETREDRWMTVKANHTYKTHMVPTQETCLTLNAYNALDIEANMAK